jgi:hypothetical protein
VEPSGGTSSRRFVNTIFLGDGPHRFKVDLAADSAGTYTIRALEANLTDEQTRNWLLSYYTDPNALPHYMATLVTAPFADTISKPADADATSGRPRFVGQVVNLLGNRRAAGNYVAVANTKDGQEIQLEIIRAGDSPRSLGNNGPPTAWPSCEFQASQGDNIMATVTSFANNVSYNLAVYLLSPVAASH